MATSGSGSGTRNPNQKRKETDKKWTRAKDPRQESESGKYPDYWSFKSRSGHNLIFDDTKDKESLTLQHRSGSAIQMDHEGAIHITAHNSQYTVVFGENRMVVSGANDITVKGDASLRVYGDLNETVHGNYNLTVMGDYNLTAKNHNRQIRGNMDTHAKNETKKFEGSSAVVARGSMARVSGKAMAVASHGDTVHIGAASGVHAMVKEGDMTFENKKGDIHVTGKDGNINVNSEKGSIAAKSQKDTSIKSTQGNVGMQADSGKASVKARTVGIEGQSEAHVTAQGTVHVKGSASTNIDASTLNLASDQAQDMPDIFGSLFKLGNFPQVSAGQSQSAQEEEDAKTWTQGLA